MKENVITSVRLDPQTYGRLRTLAGREERSVSFMMRKAVEQFVSRNQKKRSTQGG